MVYVRYIFNLYLVENFKTLFFQVSLSDHEAVTAELWLWKWNTQNKTGSKFYNVSKMYLLNLFSQINSCIFFFEILTFYKLMVFEWFVHESFGRTHCWQILIHLSFCFMEFVLRKNYFGQSDTCFATPKTMKTKKRQWETFLNGWQSCAIPKAGQQIPNSTPPPILTEQLRDWGFAILPYYAEVTDS